MTAATDNLEDLLLDHLMGVTALTMPSGIWLALYSTACTDASPGTEVAGGSYSPQPITMGAASGGTAANTAAISFVNMPGVTVVHVAIWRASTTATPTDYWMHGAVTPQVVTSGTTLTVDIGDLVLTLD